MELTLVQLFAGTNPSFRFAPGLPQHPGWISHRGLALVGTEPLLPSVGGCWVEWGEAGRDTRGVGGRASSTRNFPPGAGEALEGAGRKRGPGSAGRSCSPTGITEQRGLCCFGTALEKVSPL